MTSSESIPVLKQPVSMMETGANGTNLSTEAAARHPVDVLQKQTAGAHAYRSLNMARHVYGSGFAMVLATEKKIADQELQHQQMIGLHRGGLVGGVYGDIVMGKDVDIDFTDYLSMPEYRPDRPKHNPHSAMERTFM